MQPLVHGGGVGPLGRVHVELAHLGPVEPVHHHDVGGIAALAVAVRRVEHLLLRDVALLALDEAEGGLGRDGGGPGQAAIAGVDFVGGGAGDHEEGDALADLALPDGAPVQSRGHVGVGRVVPDDAVVAVGDHEGHADRLARRRVVVVAAVDGAAAIVEHAFLVLAQAVIVLVVGRGEGGADAIGLLTGDDVGTHLPAGHVEQDRALGVADPEPDGRRRGDEVFFHRAGWGRRIGRGDLDREARRAERIACAIGPMAPSVVGGFGYKAVSGAHGRLVPKSAQGDAHDVGGVGLHRDDAAVALERRGRLGARGAGAQQQGGQDQAADRGADHRIILAVGAATGREEKGRPLGPAKGPKPGEGSGIGRRSRTGFTREAPSPPAPVAPAARRARRPTRRRRLRLGPAWRC